MLSGSVQHVCSCSAGDSDVLIRVSMAASVVAAAAAAVVAVAAAAA